MPIANVGDIEIYYMREGAGPTILFITGLSMLNMTSSEPTFWITKLDNEPEYYTEITPEELEDFPTLQGLNKKTRYDCMTTLETTRDEKKRIIDLLTQKKD